MLTESQLKQIMPTLAAAKLQVMLPNLNAAMHTFEVNNERRAAAFLAQLAHESGEFKWMEELWGPTDAQRRYEPPSELARKLGNTEPGDGKRFKGRGPIQITGRFNYKRYGDLLGVDLLSNPERGAAPEVAFSLAGLFWTTNHLNELADAEDFVTITKRINGGTNGLADRQQYYARAKQVLAGGTFGDAPATTRGRRTSAELPKPLVHDVPPLTRGHEAVEVERVARKRKVSPTTAAVAGRPVATKAAAKAAAPKKVRTRKAAATDPPARKTSAEPARKQARDVNAGGRKG